MKIFLLYRNVLLFRHPKRTKKDGLLFLEPFAGKVWIYVILFGFVSTILLWIMTILEQNLINTPTNKDSGSGGRKHAINLESSSRNKLVLRLNKLFKQYKYDMKVLYAEKYQLFRDQYQTITLLFESFLFYASLICQQG